MPGDSPFTYMRPTDILADEIVSRLGNDGVSLFKDLLERLDQVLGVPLEVTPNEPPNTSLNVGSGIYTSPDQTRMAFYHDGDLSDLTSGVIDFAAGTISVGSVSGFSLPSMTSNYYIKALIQYEIDSDSLDVTFGNEASSQLAATIPALKVGFEPIYVVELYSPNGGVGDWGQIAKLQLIKLFVRMGGKGPTVETQTVIGAPRKVFDLVNILIPANRNKLKVKQNGVDRYNTIHYNVNSDTRITFIKDVADGAQMKFSIE